MYHHLKSTNSVPRSLLRTLGIYWLTWAVMSSDLACAIEIAKLSRTSKVDFQTEILPILRENCLACHNATDADAELVLETPASILKGGVSGAAIVPGKGNESLLLRLASRADEPAMPPPDNNRSANPLTPEQLGLIQQWINEGAQGSVEKSTRDPLAWQPIPNDFQPILATAITTDGRFAACSRGNRLFVYRLPQGQLAQQLIDTTLVNRLPELKSAADVDVVNAVSFSPDGRMLASGGFRTVKLWERLPSTLQNSEELRHESHLLAMSRDGAWSAIASEGGAIELARCATNSPPQRLTYHTATVAALQFSSDNKWLFAADADGMVSIWNTESAAMTAAIHTRQATRSMVLLQDGEHFATAGSDHIIRLWARPTAALQTAAIGKSGNPTDPVTTDAKPIREITGHSRLVTSLATVATKPNQLISGSVDGTWSLWDTTNGQRIQRGVHGDSVAHVAGSDQGSWIVSLGDDHIARVWDAQNGTMLTAIQRNPEQQNQIQSLQNTIAIGRANQTATTAAVVEARKRVADEQKARTDSLRVKAETDQALAVQIKLVAARTEEKEAAEMQAAEAANALKSADELLAATLQKRKLAEDRHAALLTQLEKSKNEFADNNTGIVDEFNLVDRAVRDSVEAERKDHDSLIAALSERQALAKTAFEAISKRVELLTSGAWDDAVMGKAKLEEKQKLAANAIDRANEAVTRTEVLLKNVSDGLDSLQSEIQRQEHALAQVEHNQQSHPVVFTCASFSHDGTQLALGDAERSIRIYDIPSGKAGDLLEGHRSAIRSVCFDSGDNLYSLAQDQRRNVYKIQTQWILRRTIGDIDDTQQLVDRVMALDFSPDGRRLATGSGRPARNGQLAVWNVADGKLVHRLDDAHSDTIFGLEFSPSGRYVASAGADRFLRVFPWEEDQLKPAKAFEGHTNYVLDVSWRANERQLATCGADNAIKVWNFVTGEQERSFAEAKKEVTSISYVGIGGNLLTSSGDHLVRLYNADDGKAVRDFTGENDFIYSSATSGDGHWIIAGGSGPLLRVWNGENGEPLVKIATDGPQTAK